MNLLEVKNLHTYFRTKKGIVKAVNCLNSGVGCSVIADGIVGAADVVVNRAGDAVLGQCQAAAEGAVDADGDHALTTEQLACGDRLLLPLFCTELIAAGGIENGSAAVDDMRHRTSGILFF